MSIWNKILLGLIIVALLPFLYFAARTLKTHKHWRELAEQYEAAVEKTETAAEVAERGDPADPTKRGVNRLRLEVHKLLVDRGRMWDDVVPGQVNPQTGQVPVTVELPAPHRIEQSTVLYVFDKAPVAQGGRYLGEFKVAQVAEKQLVLEPSVQLTPPAMLRLAQSRGPWQMYEVMPVDSHEIFADMTPEQLRAILPADTVEEYLKHGQPASPDDPPQYVVDGKFVRPLRDYDGVFKNFHLAWTILRDQHEAATRDLAYITAAVNDAKKQVEFREAEKTDLQKELAERKRELEAVVAHRQRLEQTLAGLQQDIDATIASNQAMAAEIARLQQENARKLDQSAADRLTSLP